MQTTEENGQHLPAEAPDPQSQPLPSVSPVQEDDDDPDVIFAKAVAEIDTQPLLQKKRVRVSLSMGDLLELLFDVSLFVGMLLGSAYLALTYPHTLVILYAKATPATITTSIDIPTRNLTPITLTRRETIPTTGTGHQEARAATGQLIFYNGLSTVQDVQAGAVFTGRDGEQIRTTQDAGIPAADTTTTPPTDGYTTVSAQAVIPGSKGNIAAYDVSVVFSASITVKNLATFQNGQDARTFRAVAAKDLEKLTSTVNDTLAQAFTTAFPLQKGEAAILTHCTMKATPDHQPREEAQTVTLTASKICSAVAYKQRQLTRAATAAFTTTRPGANYHIVGSLQTTLRSVSPMLVSLSGKWAYTFSQSYQDFLAEHIQGDTPAKARAYLLHTGVVSYAHIPNTLASADYINFLVLVG